MNIAPSPGILDPLASQLNLTWPKLLYEFIDNAMDAGAHLVKIDFSQKGMFRIEDDGQGCADLRLMLSLGSRADHVGTKTGRYGIGAKDAMLCIGDVVRISSYHGGFLRTVHVNWRRLRELQTWEVDDPREVQCMGKGTMIEISCLNRNLPEYPSLCRNLANTYAPALSGGTLQIQLKTPKKDFQPVQAAKPPDLDNSRSLTFTPSSTKEVRILMGLISRREDRAQEGITVSMENARVIATKTRLGLPAQATPGLYGLVELRGKGWKLSKNKDVLGESDWNDLGRLIRIHFRDLIELAQKQSTDVELKGINGLLSQVHDHIKEQHRKAKRSSPANATGRVSPQDSGQRHRQAAKVQPGDTFKIDLPRSTDSHGRLQISLQDRGPDQPLLATEGETIIVINESHKTYQAVRSVEALIRVALTYYASQAVLRQWRKQLPLFPEDAAAADQVQSTVSLYLAAYDELASQNQGQTENVA